MLVLEGSSCRLVKYLSPLVQHLVHSLVQPFWLVKDRLQLLLLLVKGEERRPARV